MTSQDGKFAMAVRLTIHFVECLHRTPVPDWAPHVADYLAKVAASGAARDSSLAMLLSLVADEMHQVMAVSVPPAKAEAEEPSTDPSAPYGGLQQLLTRFEPETWTGEDGVATSRRAERVRQMIDLIEAHFNERLTIVELAAAVGRHPVNVAADFRRETGVSIHAFVTRVRIRHAAELLSQGQKIDAVLLLVGYHSKNNFYRQFRKLMGVTPGDYQQQLVARQFAETSAVRRPPQNPRETAQSIKQKDDRRQL